MRPLDGGAAVTWDAVQEWRSAPLEQAGSDLNGELDALLRLADELDASSVTMLWSGRAADAARAERDTMVKQLEELVAELAAGRRALLQAADAVAGIERAVRDVQDFAASRQLRIGSGGTVVDAAPPAMTTARQAAPGASDIVLENDAGVELAVRKLYVDDCAARVAEVLRKAVAADADLSAVPRVIRAGHVDGDGSSSLAGAAGVGGSMVVAREVPPPPGGPEGAGDVTADAAWWSGLFPAEQQLVIEQHPEWIGNRDGVDARARDRANRLLLPRRRLELQAERDQLQQQLNQLPTGPYLVGARMAVPPNVGRRAALQARIAALDAKLASLDTVTRVASQPDRQLLSLDVTHDRAQAVVAVGDVATADHVAVFTPGLGSTVNTMLAGYDRDMSRLQNRALVDLQRHPATSSETVATVTWLGYQAPQLTSDSLLSSNSVALSGAAEDGGNGLRQFLRGIDASRPDNPDLTALGHSYGSTTTGYALHQVTGADRTAVWGSPGLGVDLPQELRVPSSAVFVERAQVDPVGDLGRFGANPDFMTGVTHLETGDAVDPEGRPLLGVSGHTHYLEDQTTSQYNLAALVAGHPEDVIRLRTDPHLVP